MLVCLLASTSMLWAANTSQIDTVCLGPVTAMPTDAGSLGKILCSQLDLTRADLSDVRAFADAGRYGDALSAWRDFKVEAWRRADLGQFGWHGDQLNGRRLSAAEWLTGRITQAEYEKKNPPANSFFRDFFRLAGPPDRPMMADWLAKDETGKYSGEYMNFFFSIPLAARYWQSGNPVYLKKWFQIAADFARNQKHSVQLLDAGTQRIVPCNWSINAQTALSEGDRIFSIIRSLGVFVKSLPDGGKPAGWDLVNQPLEHSLPAKSRELIPPIELAQVALSLVLDHPVALLKRFQSAGAVPNQRRNGLAALLFIVSELPEFKASRELMTETAIGLQDYLRGSFLADGGMLEQSFNYNQGDANSLVEMAGWCKDSYPELAAKLIDRQRAFQLMASAIVTPLGSLPAMSSKGPGNPPAIWKNARAKNDRLNSPNEPSQGTNKLSPAFTSVMFPYSGYYVQRRNWDWDTPYLFMQASRLARGHHNMGHNAVQLTAYGRPLLVTAGVPVYGPEQLPVDWRGDLNQINELLGEDSSLKLNTVIVDGISQSPGQIAQTAPETTIPARWLTSENFDFMEGIYDQGYGKIKVCHKREIVFVRKFGLWIVADILINSDGMVQNYSQIWNFPAFSEGSHLESTGFKKEQVITDSTNRCIHTTDPEGPNVWLYQSAGTPLEYSRFYGQKNPYRGWYRAGFSELLPASQIFANWKTQGDSVLLTVIYPTPNGSPPPCLWKAASGNTASQVGFTITFENGDELNCAATTGVKPIQAGKLSLDAQMLATVRYANGSGQAIVLGEKENPATGFEALYSNGKITKKTPVLIPSGFHWESNQAGTVPVYNN